jgi:CRISPR/Cas system CMR-associated protein Cmr5 small subunit
MDFHLAIFFFLFSLNLRIVKGFAGTFMTGIAVFKKEHPDKKEYLQNELKSLGVVEPDHLHNHLTDKVEEENEELQALAESIKSVYYQAYKTAYSSNSSSSLRDIRTAEKRE